jgi:TRAP transporter 4TM/12TM fusion protein
MSEASYKPGAKQQLQDMVAETETGSRKPTGAVPKKILFFVPLLWTLFQLWYASPLPFTFNILVFNSTEARAIHLAFAIFLAYTAYPTFKRSPRDFIPIQDWGLALIGAFCALYLFLFYEDLANRPGLPTLTDLAVSVTGLILLLEATRRALGPPLMAVACIFLLYTFAGPYMPDVIAHKGASLDKGMSHYWLSTEGVFGVALGVSTSMVFMFVLFGSLLEAAGAGNYFIRVAFAALGHMRGGPAKAAVVSSGMTGLVSGSSIANVVTTGTFTIPLMKKVGFKPEKAGAVEVAASTNGQLTPPVMGAAAFLMVEYVGISYLEVIKHAFLPAVISYIALVYIVHLEACKIGLRGMEKPVTRSLPWRILSVFLGFFFLVLMGGATYYGIGWIKGVAGNAAIWIVMFLLLAVYMLLISLACRVDDLEESHEIKELPRFGPTAQAGLYFLLPIVVLMWCLIVERFSPSLSAFWATLLMMFIALTQRPLKGLFRRVKDEKYSLRLSFQDLIVGMVSGGSNMIGIGVATAAAGIVVGTVTLTGIGQVMTQFVEVISGGNLLLILLFTAVISLLLGMGLPTTANYIVVSSLMAPVIVTLGAKAGLIVPLIAVHLFVFYFGILADDTPPVGLAAFAASGISGGDPIRTGVQGFVYDMRTAILPFIFIFNNELLLIGVGTWFHLTLIIVASVIAMLCFAAGTQRYFQTKNRTWESLALLLVAFTLLRPGFWWDRIYPPLLEKPASQMEEILGEMKPGDQLRITIKGEDFDGKEYTKTVMLPVGKGETGADKLAEIGIETRRENGDIYVDMVSFASPAEKAGITFDQKILSIQLPAERPPQQLMFIPALILLGLVFYVQRRRKKRLEAP